MAQAKPTEAILIEKNLNIVAAGALLKSFRERMDLSQIDVAKVLGYRNANFISMLESGRSSIPVGRIMDIVNAYQIDSETALVLLKRLQPELWELFKRIIAANKELLKPNSFNELDRQIDERFIAMLKQLGLENFSKAVA